MRTVVVVFITQIETNKIINFQKKINKQEKQNILWAETKINVVHCIII